MLALTSGSMTNSHSSLILSRTAEVRLSIVRKRYEHDTWGKSAPSMSPSFVRPIAFLPGALSWIFLCLRISASSASCLSRSRSSSLSNSSVFFLAPALWNADMTALNAAGESTSSEDSVFVVLDLLALRGGLDAAVDAEEEPLR